MEKYSSACRLILIADSVNESFKRLCVVGAFPCALQPRGLKILKGLYDIMTKEKLAASARLCSKVAVFAKRDLRRAILALEACRVANYPFKETQSVQTTDWGIVHRPNRR